MSSRLRAPMMAAWLVAWMGIAVALPAQTQRSEPPRPGPMPLTGRFAGPAATAFAGPPQMTVRVAARTLGRPIAPGFLGLSMEYPAVRAYAGANPRSLNPVFVQLIRNLAARPVLRIGGDSTDRTWWPVAGKRRPAGVSFSLTRRWLATARALAQATDGRLILGINLEANNPVVASAEARALLRGIGRQRVQALEIGNEPDLYDVFPWNHTRTGHPIEGRAASYNFGQFSDEFATISRAVPPVSLAGPAISDFSWLPDLKGFLASEPAVHEVTFHRYPLNRCILVPSSPLYPSVPNLLTRSATIGLMQVAAPYIAIAHRRGVSVRVDEMNAVTCGGVWGISNTFASALWALDAMYVVARSGANGVNIHTSPFPGTPNELFTFRRRHGRWFGTVRPEYYGLLMFARTVTAGSRFLRIATTGSGPVRSWATVGPGGQTHVTLINDSFTNGRSVLVLPPTPSVSATLVRLTASSPYETRTITLAGQSFAARSTTGVLRRPTGGSVPKSVDGGFRVQVPPASAAVLTIAPAGAGGAAIDPARPRR